MKNICLLNTLSDFDEYVIEDFFDNIKYSEYENNECIIVGTLGLWSGKKSIVPVRSETLSDALYKCFKSGDNFLVDQVDGYLMVKCYHHDGVNEFIIHLLNKKGAAIINDELLDKNIYHRKIKRLL